MHISEAVKERVRKYEGKSIQIDAKKVDQPINPGDGLIKELAYLGPAPAAQDWVPITGLGVRVTPAFSDGERPRFSIAIQNDGTKEIEVSSLEFAPTLLMKKTGKKFPFEPSDGPSITLITRRSLGGIDPEVKGRDWNIDAALPGRFKLNPQDKRVVTITLDLPKGEYDFLAGYGGGVHEGKGIASNLVAFDVSANGAAKLVTVKGR
jgi:hypothetical protein